MAEKQENMSPIEIKVARQVEYYFGDHNLPKDKFLKEQLQLDEGWVALETLLKFNRLKSLTTEISVIAEAIQKSNAGLLEVSEDKTKIRRSPDKPLPEMNDDYKDALKHKSVYMKGFPLETTLDQIQEWLNEKDIENIQLRRNLERLFKGSVFICFVNEESAKKFLERTDIKSFKDNDMLVLSREDYHAKKAEDRKHYKAESKAKAKQDKDDQQKQVEDKEMGLLLSEKTGCLLKFSGELEDVSREDFHELFSGHGKIKWVDFTRGAKEGTLLFDGIAKEAFDNAKEAHGGELKIKSNSVTWKVLEGEEEKEEMKKIIEAQQESFNRTKNRSGGRGGGGGGGRGRSGGRGGRGRSGGRGGRGGGRDQGRSNYKGKKTKFDDGDDAPIAPKREREDNDGPAAKVPKTENGS
ncbi:hypothetical protein CgunFtcFv8_024554 [Champsocephalus gunnari]|uniref:Lupus La protein n=1 Tax=Champsocephalus gunnari TaxID=52237 RepID=A0AAN8DC31_CHAGU|nr:hypothetical protein CgunFtcFv8_024554 [Champsocephalus gunnari]